MSFELNTTIFIMSCTNCYITKDVIIMHNLQRLDVQVCETCILGISDDGYLKCLMYNELSFWM